MNESEQLITITNMTLGEFRKFQKALRLLMSLGIMQWTATAMLCEALKAKKEYRSQFAAEVRIK